jgi:hypothetical protein
MVAVFDGKHIVPSKAGRTQAVDKFSRERLSYFVGQDIAAPAAAGATLDLIAAL